MAHVTTAHDAPGAVVLHALPVGGGIVALSSLPGEQGDYAGDLEHLASWRPAMVISVVTHVELVEAGGQDLGQQIQDKGTRWVHLALALGQAANANTEEIWPAISDQARRALLGGGRVVVNSRNGGPRAAMIVLRLMVEAGEAADEAQVRLAAILPELEMSPEQKNWALSKQPDPVPFVRHPNR